MMNKWLAVLLMGIPLWMATGAAQAGPIFANTTGGRLISFDSATPGTILSNVAITGVAGALVGIDFRPGAPGTLYGVGNNGGVGSVYVISTITGVATPINTGFALDGTSFGVDFNPVPDALRIVSNSGQNLRITGGGAGVVNIDGTLNIGGVTQTNVVDAAYTNSFAGATTTTLFVLQDNAAPGSDVLFIQNPPNNGALNPVANLTINVSQLSGFDNHHRRPGVFELEPVGHPQSDHRPSREQWRGRGWLRGPNRGYLGPQRRPRARHARATWPWPRRTRLLATTLAELIARATANTTPPAWRGFRFCMRAAEMKLPRLTAFGAQVQVAACGPVRAIHVVNSNGR